MKPAHGSRRHRLRLLALLGTLSVVAAIYLATARWRGQLLEESARSRRVIAGVERARAARKQQLARERELTAVLQSQPENVEARLALAQLRWAEGGPRAAVTVLQSAPKGSADRRVLRLLAAALRAMGREDLALAALDRAVRLAPADGDLQAERAVLFSLLGWFPQARAALAAAERRGADANRVALVRATMARQHGDLRAARRELETPRRHAPDDPELIRQLAAVAEEEGHASEAILLLRPLAEVEADPDVWVALARLSLHRMDSPALGEARADLQRALDLRPDMPAARRMLGRCLRLGGEQTEARTVLESLYRQHPRQPGVAFELAQLYRDLGLTDRVGRLMAEHEASVRRSGEMHRAAMAVMEHPDSPQDHLQMGQLCLERGMLGRAILSLERAMALDSGLPGAREALANARARRSSGDGGEE
jgi:tetratricopeptide (TPR) repeat protein